MINRDRDRLINLIIYFANNTRLCHKLKLLKLLYFADFRHYREAGKPITTFEYEAWEHGPVPPVLNRELKNPKEDLSLAVKISGGEERMLFQPRRPFQEKFFTARELKTIREVTDIFKDATSEQMEASSHEPGLPWRKVFQAHKNIVVPFESAPTNLTDDEVAERKADRNYLRELFS